MATTPWVHRVLEICSRLTRKGAKMTPRDPAKLEKEASDSPSWWLVSCEEQMEILWPPLSASAGTYWIVVRRVVLWRQ